MIRVGSPAGTATNSNSRPCRSAPITKRRSCPAYSYSTSRMALRHACSMSASVIPCLRAESRTSTRQGYLDNLSIRQGHLDIRICAAIIIRTEPPTDWWERGAPRRD